MTANRPLESALPGLVKGFDDVHVEILTLAQCKHILDDARLVRPRRERALAHATGAWPTNLADQDLLARKCVDHLTADCLNMGDRVAGGNRKILPIRQNMYRDKVNGVGHVGVTQPELPDVGVSHRDMYARLDCADRVSEVCRGHIAAQQHLIAHDNRTDRAGIFVREGNGGFDLVLALERTARQPQPLHHFQAMPGGNPGNLVQPEIDRVRAYAVRDLSQARKIILDLRHRNDDGRVERRLAAAERRVGNAIELFSAAVLRWRQKHRSPKPGPDTGYCHCRKGEAGEGMAHRQPNRKRPIVVATAYRATSPLPSWPVLSKERGYAGQNSRFEAKSCSANYS